MLVGLFVYLFDPTIIPNYRADLPAEFYKVILLPREGL